LVNKNVAKWQKRIEDTFFGPSGVVGESIFKLKQNEDTLERRYVQNEDTLFNLLFKDFRGYAYLMDAFFGFYADTFELIKKRQERKWPNKISLITGIHVPTFWRFRASYIIFWKGYFVDAIDLLRSILENALTIIALNKDIITVENAFGDIHKEKLINGKIDKK